MLKIERLATEQELDTVLVDVWSFRSDADGVMERTDAQTVTLREATLRSGVRPLVTVYISPRDQFYRLLNMQL